MKRDRHEIIRQIINENAVETQEQLQSLLTEKGIVTTQATISRDMKELGLTKVSYDGNRHKYVIGEIADPYAKQSYKQVMDASIVSIDYSDNIIVLKTVAGMAMAVGAGIDNLSIDGVMGCIAGDDTLFMAIKDKNRVKQIVELIEKQHM